MNEPQALITGGCLCGAIRYQARGAPTTMGHCYCADCRKASGSGFIPFMGFASSALQFSGQPRQHSIKSASGRYAIRNFCGNCGGLVFGGVIGESPSFTIYAGSLDDATLFVPSIAIFTRGRPAWALIPKGLIEFEGLPG